MMPSTIRPKSKKKFLADYDMDEDFLVNPDPVHGRPGVLRGRDPEGRDVLVKVWPGGDETDDDLEQIWRSEIRQLQRLAAVPRAEELFVPMLSSGEDNEGFYLVLDPGQGSPLEIFRRAKNKPNVLTHPRLPRNRRRLWANALRIAEALELLHAQGVIHRNLDPWAIVTSFGDQPDFRLTGFEWSMRIATVGGKDSTPALGGRDTTASFGRDWINLGLLVSELVGAPAERVAELKIAPSDIADHVSAAEGQVLRGMMQLQAHERLDGELLCRRIADIVSAITAQAAGKEAKLALALRLGSGSRLAEAIRRASDNEIETADVPAQLEFVANDLSHQPYFARLKNQDAPDSKFALFGQFLSYGLSPFRQPGSTEAADWEFAVCDRADLVRPPPGAIIGSEQLDPAALEIATTFDAAKSFPRKRGRVERWDAYLLATEPKEVRKTDFDRMHQAFSLLLVLEMAYAAADVFPIVALPDSSDLSGDLHQLRVASRYDPGRAESHLISAAALVPTAGKHSQIEIH